MKKLILLTTMILILTSCITSRANIDIEIPEKPVMYTVNFEKVEGGYFLTYDDAKKIALNKIKLEEYIDILLIMTEGQKNVRTLE